MIKLPKGYYAVQSDFENASKNVFVFKGVEYEVTEGENLFANADAVISGKIGALGCDVYSKEPFGEDHPFSAILDRPNVCLTPHMAWGSYEARQRCVRRMAENITEFYKGNNHNRIC